jgi:radical SAM protein with 4Fe4S-binding SPASM domain
MSEKKWDNKISFNGPLRVNLEVTDKCNLNCIYCYNKNKKIKDKILSFDEIKKIIDILKKNTVVLTVTGGEPLMRDEIFEILRYASKKIPKVNLLTNGTLLDELKIVKLKDIHLNVIQLSLDSPDESINDQLRGKGVFQKVLYSLKLLDKFKMSYSIMTIVSKINYMTCFSFNLFDQINNIKYHGFERATLSGKDVITQKLILTSNEWLFFIKKMLELSNKKVKFQFSDPLKNILIRKKIEFGGCIAGIANLSISCNGDIYPCARFNYCIGNFLNFSNGKDFFYFWQNNRVLNLLRNRKNLKGKCGRCIYREQYGGCRGNALGFSSDFLAEDPQCFLELVN